MAQSRGRSWQYQIAAVLEPFTSHMPTFVNAHHDAFNLSSFLLIAYALNSHTGHCDTVGKMAEKVKEVALEESNRLKALTGDAAKSGAYLYPIRVRNEDDRDKRIGPQTDWNYNPRVSSISPLTARYGSHSSRNSPLP